MHTTWANDPVNSPNHYTRSHPGMECIELTADTSRFNDQTIGTVHIRRDHRDKLSPYLLEYQPTDPKEDQA